MKKEVNNMNYPKLVIASDGTHTGVLLDGVFIGQGIQRLDFSARSEDGKTKSAIRILDLDVEAVRLERDTERFSKFLYGIAEEEPTD